MLLTPTGVWASTGFSELVQNLFPNADAPYRALESLMNTGFSLLAAEMKFNPGLRIEELLKKETGAP